MLSPAWRTHRHCLEERTEHRMRRAASSDVRSSRWKNTSGMLKLDRFGLNHLAPTAKLNRCDSVWIAEAALIGAASKKVRSLMREGQTRCRRIFDGGVSKASRPSV